MNDKASHETWRDDAVVRETVEAFRPALRSWVYEEMEIAVAARDRELQRAIEGMEQKHKDGPDSGYRDINFGYREALSDVLEWLDMEAPQ